MFVNLTPHPVSIITEGNLKTFPPSGVCPRLNEEITDLPPIDGVPMCTKRMVRDDNALPAPTSGTLYIVSYAIAQAYPERRDLVVPNGLVRNGNGVPMAARKLAFFAPTADATEVM